jgi:uncharacterized protein YecT (DUF1311 family)
MTIRVRCLAFLVVTSFLTVSPSFAAPSVVLSVHDLTGPGACLKSAQTQVAINQCNLAAFRKAQGRLSAVLKSEHKLFSSRYVDASENAWLVYRSKECSLQSSPYSGGSIYPSDYHACEAYLTDLRIDQIRKDIQNASIHH